MCGRPSVRGDRVQCDQQLARLSQRSFRRRVEPAQRIRVANPRERQFEREWREIGAEDLRPAPCQQRRVLALAPQAIAHPRRGAPGAPRALHRRVLSDAHSFQSRHSRLRIEPRYAREPGIHHGPDAFDGQACFGDGGGEHDLSPPGQSRGDRRVLIIAGH